MLPTMADLTILNVPSRSVFGINSAKCNVHRVGRGQENKAA